MWYLQIVGYPDCRQRACDMGLVQIPLRVTDFENRSRARIVAGRIIKEELTDLFHRIDQKRCQLVWVEEIENFPK